MFVVGGEETREVGYGVMFVVEEYVEVIWKYEVLWGYEYEFGFFESIDERMLLIVLVGNLICSYELLIFFYKNVIG